MNFAYTNGQLYIHVTEKEAKEVAKRLRLKPKIMESGIIKTWSIAVLEWKISENKTITFQT